MLQQISYMSWVAEGVLNRSQPWQNWKPKFFALRGADVCIFEKPPVRAKLEEQLIFLCQRLKVLLFFSVGAPRLVS